MWFKVACLLVVFSASQGWEAGKKYEYLIGSKIFQDGKETKIFAAGLLQFKWSDSVDATLIGRFRPKYLGDKISFQDYVDIPKDSFQVLYGKDGLIRELKVSEDTSAWKVEFIRGMMGLLQVADSYHGKRDEFTIMEESVAGKCKTYYKVTKDSSLTQIVKTRNYTDCEKTPVFERGVFGTNNYDVLMKKRDIISRNSRSGYILNKDDEIIEANIREDVQVFSDNNTIEFTTEIGLWYDAEEIKKIKEKTDDDDFFIENLTSVGGLMYRPKPQKRYCYKTMGLHRNEIDSSCETDYYMNPRKFDTAYDGNEVSLAKELVEQIARELKNPSEIPKTNTLDRFTVLVGMIRYMDVRRMEEVAKFWDNSGSEAFVFQSAVFKAGTLEALEMIRILKKRDDLGTDFVNVGALPENVHPLSLEYLDLLFEFATDPDLMEKDFDFSKDLFLAFSNLLRRYSTEMEKPFKQEQLNKLILTKYRKYLSGKLQNAIYARDDLKFQVYVRALGNMADLSLFNYYLNNRYDRLTPFQKTFIVNSMDNTVAMYPEKSRVLLMKLYRNSEETFSVRTAAVYQLFKTDLPEDMVVDIIEIAKGSNNGHIQSAVKTTVLSEGYNYHLNDKINEIAQSMEIVKEEIPTSTNDKFSESRFHDFSDKMKKEFAFIEAIRGMDDNPLSIFLKGQTDRKGFKSTFKFGGMIDHFQNYARGFSTQMTSFYDRIRTKASSANIEIDNDFAQTFIPFVDLRSSPRDLVRLFEEDKNYRSRLMGIDSEVVIGFPTESGLPFLYTYQSPEFQDFEIATHVDDTFKLDINLIWSVREQIKMGFANPVNGKHYVHGIDINKQLNIPLTVSYKSYGPTHVVTVDPLFRDRNQRLVHLATWPYTGVRDLFPIRPVAEDKNTVNAEAENLFNEEMYLDDSETLRVKVVSTEISSDGNMNAYLDGKELDAYLFSGPFGEVKPTHNLFNIFFKDDLNHPTSFIMKIDLSNKLVLDEQNEDAGSIRGPFLFLGRVILRGDVELTGQTNRSASLEVHYHNDLASNVAKVGWEGSYLENDTKVYEACFDTFIEQNTPSYLDESDHSQMTVFTKLKFGEKCSDGTFISAETKINPDVLDQKSDFNLTVTVDFDGLPDEIAKEICEYEGESYPGKDAMAMNLKIVQKDQEKCDAVTKNTEEIAMEKDIEELVPEKDREEMVPDNIFGDSDVEILDMMATE